MTDTDGTGPDLGRTVDYTEIVDGMTPDERAEVVRRAKLLQTARTLEAEIGRISEQHAEKKAEAAGLAKERDAAIARLRSTIREVDEPTLPFPEVTMEEGDTSWRAVPLDQLTGMNPTDAKKMAEADLFTIGDIADWTSVPNPKQLTDIPGIGAQRAEAIADALEGFWQQRREAAKLDSDAAADLWEDSDGDEDEGPERPGRPGE